MARPVPWGRAIGPQDLWCDDPAHADYNRLVTAPFPATVERMRRGDRLYDLVVLLDWNWPKAQPGRGSAIFLHRWRKRGHPTEGCIAMAPRDLLRFVQAAPPATRVIVR